MIPKIIHYCWFGQKEKPKLVVDCINSWRHHLPDFEIIEWNEQNTELKNYFPAYFMKRKKWAFVADYIRFQVLYDYGGVYLDTDMLVCKKLEPLLENTFFLGAECDEFLSGAIIGSVKKHFFLKEALGKYDKINLSKIYEFSEITIPRILTGLYRDFINGKIEKFNSLIRKNKMTIYPKEYFYPLPFEERHTSRKIAEFATSNTYCIHLWNFSWSSFNEFHFFRIGKYGKGLKMILRGYNTQPIDLKYIRKVASCIKISLND